MDSTDEDLTLSSEDVFCLSMESIYRNGLRKPIFKSSTAFPRIDREEDDEELARDNSLADVAVSRVSSDLEAGLLGFLGFDAGPLSDKGMDADSDSSKSLEDSDSQLVQFGMSFSDDELGWESGPDSPAILTPEDSTQATFFSERLSKSSSVDNAEQVFSLSQSCDGWDGNDMELVVAQNALLPWTRDASEDEDLLLSLLTDHLTDDLVWDECGYDQTQDLLFLNEILMDDDEDPSTSLTPSSTHYLDSNALCMTDSEDFSMDCEYFPEVLAVHHDDLLVVFDSGGELEWD